MSSTFGILFSVRIDHSYYTSRCEDFEFLIPAETAAMFRNRRVISRTDKGVFYALCEKDNAGVPRVAVKGLTFRIGIRLKNTLFSNFTAMDFAAGITPLYRNQPPALLLDAGTETFLTGQLFGHPLSKPNRPVAVAVRDKNNTVIQESSIADPLDTTTVSVDLRNCDPGLYSVTEKYSGSTKKYLYYLDPELIMQQCFGILEISVDDNFYATPVAPQFAISFEAKKETLKYYIVGKNYSKTELSHLAVIDAGFTEDARTEVTFLKVGQDSFSGTDISPSLLTDTKSKVILFKSTDAIPRLEKPRKKIQLSKNSDVIMKHLPLPGTDKSTSDIIIQISKP